MTNGVGASGRSSSLDQFCAVECLEERKTHKENLSHTLSSVGGQRQDEEECDRLGVTSQFSPVACCKLSFLGGDLSTI
jgi:hypothetical protein